MISVAVPFRRCGLVPPFERQQVRLLETDPLGHEPVDVVEITERSSPPQIERPPEAADRRDRIGGSATGSDQLVEPIDVDAQTSEIELVAAGSGDDRVVTERLAQAPDGRSDCRPPIVWTIGVVETTLDQGIEVEPVAFSGEQRSQQTSRASATELDRPSRPDELDRPQQSQLHPGPLPR